MVIEESIHVVFDEVNFTIDEIENLAEKVDKLKLNDEVYWEGEEIEDASKNIVREATHLQSLQDDPYDENVAIPETTKTPQQD